MNATEVNAIAWPLVIGIVVALIAVYIVIKLVLEYKKQRRLAEAMLNSATGRRATVPEADIALFLKPVKRSKNFPRV